MQTKKEQKKTSGISSGSSANNKKRIAIKSGPDGFGGISKGAPAMPLGNAISFALKPIGRSLYGLHVKALQGDTHELSDPELQLKAISDIHPVISKLPGYKENKRWKETDHPADILHCLLSQYEKISDLEYWNLKRIGNNYSITGIAEYGYVNAQWMTMSFLSKMNQRYSKLHDLLLYSFMLVSKINGIGLPFDWVKMNKQQGHHGMMYEYLMEKLDMFGEGDEEDIGNINKWIAYYGPDGIPAAYCRLMQRGSSIKIWEAEYKNFLPTDKIERSAKDYLKVAYELMKTKMSIHDYSHNPHSEGLNPGDYMQIIWSTNDDDAMWQMHCDHTDDMFQEYGAIPFRWEKDAYKPPDKKKIHAFCDLVRKFFDEGQLLSDYLNKQFKSVAEQKPLTTKKIKKDVYLINKII